MTALGRPVVVMGVSGSGKTTLGTTLGEALGLPFVDADDLHPAMNKALMAAGIPLSDVERWPWLEVVAQEILQGHALGRPPVVACSALKRAYRDLLRAHVPDLVFVYLDGSAQTIADRLMQREHEYMPASLLTSQVAALEPPDEDELHITVPLKAPLLEAVELVVAALGSLDAPARQLKR